MTKTTFGSKRDTLYCNRSGIADLLAGNVTTDKLRDSSFVLDTEDPVLKKHCLEVPLVLCKCMHEHPAQDQLLGSTNRAWQKTTWSLVWRSASTGTTHLEEASHVVL